MIKHAPVCDYPYLVDCFAGGCVARTVIDQPQSPPLIQIQTRIAPLPPDPNNTMTGYTGFHCEESNPSGGSNWSRLCPCLVNITTPVSVAPSSEPSVVPSLQANLNTIYIRGALMLLYGANRYVLSFCECLCVLFLTILTCLTQALR